MSSRPNQPSPDSGDLESLAQDLLGVNFAGDDDLDDPMDIAGLGLDDLGFGAPLEPAPIESKKIAEDIPSAGAETEFEAERQADLLNLLAGGKRQPGDSPGAHAAERSESSEAVPVSGVARRPAAEWIAEDEDDEFGAGLLAEAPTRSAPPVRETPRSAKAGSRSVKPNAPRKAEFLEDEFGADLDLDANQATPVRGRKASETSDFGDLDDEESALEIEVEAPGVEGVDEQEASDPYWDALESWDWEESSAQSRRSRGNQARSESGSGRRSDQGPGRDSRKGRDKRDKPGRSSARVSPATSGPAPSDRGERETEARNEGSKRKGRPERPERRDVAAPAAADEEAKPERSLQAEPRRTKEGARRGEARPASESDRPARREKARPVQGESESVRRVPSVSRRPVESDFDDEDDFGSGLLEASAFEEEVSSEPAEVGSDEDRKGRRRRGRRRGRRDRDESSSKSAFDRELAPLAADSGDVDEEEFEEPGELGPVSEDDFGAGLLGEEVRPQRRPPRHEKATRPDVEAPAQRSSRGTGTRETSDAERSRDRRAAGASKSTRSSSAPVTSEDAAEDRYKGIPSWMDAINLLARKPPAVRSGSSSDRRGRSRGGREGGGGGRHRRD